MALSEKTHAYLLISFYKSLKESDVEGYEDIFQEATILYGRQRGKRMSLRAEKYDIPKDYIGYLSLGEMALSHEITPEYCNNGDFICHVTKCIWHDVMEKENLVRCGELYCRHIDHSLVKGFNEELAFELGSVLHNDHTCKLNFVSANLLAEGAAESFQKIAEGAYDIKMPMAYHIDHLNKTFQEVIQKRCNESEHIINQALKEFEKYVGSEVIGRMGEFDDLNFNILP